uniref:Uncharacterized protein n=1 Tax=Avena sativa TaxID=4498 RepID=A0ACD5YYZ1_AVESA
MDSGRGGGAAPPTAADEEGALRRRGADCVYYLVSPLTCKKGSECEYRHSDAARANPRDCWYWFNGNCANPKCSFRHPPLDDMLGAPAAPRASQQSAPQVSVPAHAPASGAAKPGVPCYYFQKGMCAKGNLCAFSHVPQFAGSPALHQTAKSFAPAVQPHLQSKNSNSWIKPSNSAQQNTAPAVHDEPKIGARNGILPQKQNPTTRAYPSSGTYQNHNNSYVLSGTAKSYRPQPSVEDETAETGEFVREPSAGSSVVAGSVDDDAERSFKEVHNSYRRTNGEQNAGMRRQTHGGYEIERSHRSSSDRLLSERRLSSQRDPVPVTANSSDLRHRLLKQRRLNDQRSTQVPDRQDRRYPEGDHRRRGEERASHDGLSRSRLHGRIKLPAETPLDRLGPYPEKERRPRDRVSPPKQTDLRAKIHDRLKARSNEDISGNNNVKSSVVKANSGEDAAAAVSFSGPKSLAELRAKKVAANSSGQHTAKNADRTAGPARMTSEIVITNRDSPDPVPFDGPKPLSVILKRKREEAASADSGSIQEEQIEVEEEESLNNNSIILQKDDVVGTNTEDNEEEEAFHPEDDMMYDDSLSPDDDNAAEAAADAGKEELEDGEQQEDLETAEEEYEYEAADDVNAEEDNDYQEYEDDDDLEDDDDFARKVGVLIS